MIGRSSSFSTPSNGYGAFGSYGQQNRGLSPGTGQPHLPMLPQQSAGVNPPGLGQPPQDPGLTEPPPPGQGEPPVQPQSDVSQFLPLGRQQRAPQGGYRIGGQEWQPYVEGESPYSSSGFLWQEKQQNPDWQPPVYPGPGPADMGVNPINPGGGPTDMGVNPILPGGVKPHVVPPQGVTPQIGGIKPGISPGGMIVPPLGGGWT